jgi:hypothetical protein
MAAKATATMTAAARACHDQVDLGRRRLAAGTNRSKDGIPLALCSAIPS